MKKLLYLLAFVPLFLKADITGIVTPPAAPNGSVQYNCRGRFCGDSDMTFSSTTNRMSIDSILVSSIVFRSDGSTQTAASSGGGIGGSINASAQNNVGYYSGAGSTTTISGSTSFTWNGTTVSAIGINVSSGVFRRITWADGTVQVSSPTTSSGLSSISTGTVIGGAISKSIIFTSASGGILSSTSALVLSTNSSLSQLAVYKPNARSEILVGDNAFNPGWRFGVENAVDGMYSGSDSAFNFIETGNSANLNIAILEANFNPANQSFRSQFSDSALTLSDGRFEVGLATDDVKTTIFSTGAIQTGSASITGAGGLGVTYGITAATMTVSSTGTFGAVGIGTTSPQRPLHVVGGSGAVPVLPPGLGANDWALFENNGNINISLIGGDTGTSSLRFYENGSATSRGEVQYSNSTQDMVFVTSATGRMYILGSNGNVGIGNSAPSDKLQVSSGTVRIDGSSSGIIVSSAATFNGNVYFSSSNALSGSYGTSGQVVTSSGIGLPWYWSTAGGGTPGGSTLQVQYNNAGAFGGIANSTVFASSVSFSTVAIQSLTLGTSDYGTYGSSGTITPNYALGNNFYITLTSSATIAGPTNGVKGATLKLRVTQDATGSRVVTIDQSTIHFGVDISTAVFSTTGSRSDYMLLQYDERDSIWDILAFVRGLQ